MQEDWKFTTKKVNISLHELLRGLYTRRNKERVEAYQRLNHLVHAQLEEEELYDISDIATIEVTIVLEAP